MKGFVSFITGIIFSVGLAVGGMTDPKNVKAFLDVTGDWDFRLMFVMIGAILVHAISFRLILKRSRPVLETKFQIPSLQKVDKRLIFGAIIFGLGWGWAGICPGPGIVGLASGRSEFYIFIFAMLFGMKVFQINDRRNNGN